MCIQTLYLYKFYDIRFYQNKQVRYKIIKNSKIGTHRPWTFYVTKQGNLTNIDFKSIRYDIVFENAVYKCVTCGSLSACYGLLSLNIPLCTLK